jgi:NodT family efflux transporter outer membrane factor (OMF) lipoprotein
VRRFGACLAAGLALAASGCMVGPDYTKPEVLVPADFKEANGWKVARPSDTLPRGRWWEIFGDAELDELEEQLTAANQDLKVAEGRYREARALIGFARAGLFPTISAGTGIAAVRPSGNAPYATSQPPASGDFLLSLGLSYEVDLWGRVRRSVNAARDLAAATAADLESAKLLLQAELALNYFDLRAADAQQQLLDATVDAYTAALELTRNRFEGGAAPRSDFVQAETQLEHAIAILVGRPPATLSIARRPLRMRPPDVPLSLPSELLERRPDVAAAERRVAEANEQIGIARAAFFPTVALNATVGLEGSTLGNWFTWPSLFWAVGSSVTQTLFDAGRRRATSEITIARYDATVAQYRQTTLEAFQQVEDNLAALRILERAAEQQARAVASAQLSLELFTNRYRGGVDTYLQVITAQTAALSNERNEVDIRRRRMSATVLLVKALGGGWTVGDLPQLGGTAPVPGAAPKAKD